MELAIYDSACRALARAKSFDEVKEISNRAEAARAYARQAKNRQLELDAIEIRVRAERKLGELILQLKQANKLGVQGVREHTERGATTIRLSDIGIDGSTSGKVQRLAKLSESTVEREISEWRRNAEVSTRIEFPLQRYRNPSVRADRQRDADRYKKRSLDPRDLVDRFRAIDGRRISDWRSGELERIEQQATQILHVIGALFESMPVANPDPLDTMEMIFGQQRLCEVLEPIFDAPIAAANAGVDSERIRAAKDARAQRYRRECKHCGSEFIMRRPSGAGMRGEVNEGQFCSRACLSAFRSAKIPAGKYHRTCERCERAFTVNDSSKKGRFCSRVCQRGLACEAASPAL